MYIVRFNKHLLSLCIIKNPLKVYVYFIIHDKTSSSSNIKYVCEIVKAVFAVEGFNIIIRDKPFSTSDHLYETALAYILMILLANMYIHASHDIK